MHRPEVIVGLLTTQTAGADTPLTACFGTGRPLACTALRSSVLSSRRFPWRPVTATGRLSDGDWQAVETRL